MGADLYIKPIHTPIREQWMPKFDEACALRNAAQDEVAKAAAQKLVDEAYDHIWSNDGYFRDSYNATSILHRLGLSWWRDLKHDVPYDEATDSYPNDVNVSADACRKFLAKVLESGEPRPVNAAWLRAKNCAVSDAEEGENSVASWNAYYHEKYMRLIAFLERGIEHGGIYAST